MFEKKKQQFFIKNFKGVRTGLKKLEERGSVMSFWNSESSLYYLHLWMEKSISERFPFLEYMVQKGAPPYIYEEVMELLDVLEKKWNEEKEEGMLRFDSLAFHYVGMLPPELEPEDTLKKLQEEGIHKELVEVLLIWIKK